MCAMFTSLFFFFFNDTATTEIYTRKDTLSLHDALPISQRVRPSRRLSFTVSPLANNSGRSAFSPTGTGHRFGTTPTRMALATFLSTTKAISALDASLALRCRQTQTTPGPGAGAELSWSAVFTRFQSRSEERR